MSKIDLLDQKWIDLVFEGKNEAYGAYQIRRDTGKRNLMGLLLMLLGIAVIWGGAMGISKVSEAIAASKEHETVVELEAVEEEVPEEEEIEVVYQEEELEQLVEQEEVMNSEKFTAY
ncbi:MAG: energy transducer TonB, partial [Prevotella sp.]|nr:energy transducer TonB [Prevotella sp.]